MWLLRLIYTDDIWIKLYWFCKSEILAFGTNLYSYKLDWIPLGMDKLDFVALMPQNYFIQRPH